MQTIFALETSCDETAVAILRGRELLASELASQMAEHDKYGGVVPEVASRNHLRQAPRLLRQATKAAGIGVRDIDAFAATSGPGLASSLMIGASIAKGLAIGLGKPYLGINHLEGHLLSPFFGCGVASASSRCLDHGQDARAIIEPNISLIVSGGHTMLIEVSGLGDYRLMGRTVDDAAGEAFDKVAKMLGLRYPGGPEIEKHARAGDPTRFDLPRSMLDSDNFSFSGLKTAVRYLLPKIAGRFCEMPDAERRLTQTPYNLPDTGEIVGRRSSPPIMTAANMAALQPEVLADLCASFQQAVIDVLVRKTIAAAKSCRQELVTVSGGVSCNNELRRQLNEACKREGLRLKSAERWLSTDNAAMIAFAASLRLQNGFQSRVTEEIDPNLALV